ncbi:FGGY-family carbohydrate kinase, partial [Kitasatospora herbaricolor]|uniref:FGGY-family carbohydrate kinase n=1 Tax=Kitasatospora herbaricolor TaxID=68217 RepID=UPI0036DEE0B1
LLAHGGMFRTAGVAQRFLAGALDAPVSVAQTASEGGASGIAVLAAYVSPHRSGVALDEYLRRRVFGGFEFETTTPHPDDVAGFAAYLEQYGAGLAIEQAAVAAVSPASRPEPTSEGTTP